MREEREVHHQEAEVHRIVNLNRSAGVEFKGMIITVHAHSRESCCAHLELVDGWGCDIHKREVDGNLFRAQLDKKM